MSRIGKEKITIPVGVDVSFEGRALHIKGPKGEMNRTIPDEISVNIEKGILAVEPVAKTKIAQSLWGTYASHAKNMVYGVTEGYTKVLEVHGIGYRSEMAGNKLVLKVGFSHAVEKEVPQGLEVTVKDNLITIHGFDKELVGEFAAKVRLVRKPEPYKGKGIRYQGEIVRRKQGKKTA